MTKLEKEVMIDTIIEREKLRPLDRATRLFKDPVRAAPFYVLAALGHLKPFIISFKTLWGTKMKCYLPEGNTFYYYGYCEANLTNFFLRYVMPGMTCLDIGAHIGFYTALFSELTEVSGKVHGFEPTPWTYRILFKNTEGLANVVVNNLAISEKEQDLSFADYGAGYGAFNSAHPKGAAELSMKPAMTTVHAVSLDAYCAEKNISPDIVKIDAEGFEANVLRGMSSIMSPSSDSPNRKRPIITIEVAGKETWAENRNEAFDILSKASYEPYEISIDGFLKKHSIKENYVYDNLVFIPAERKLEKGILDYIK